MRSVRAISLAAVIVAAACNRPASNPHGRVAEPYLPDAGSVGFELEPSKLVDGSLRFRATYKSQGKSAHFSIELAIPSDAEGTQDFPVKFGKGTFVAEPGSDASVLLADLRKALMAKTLPELVSRSASLPFTFANIGEHMSQAEGGGFNEMPRGNWTAVKIFVGEGDREAEMFFNFNLAIGKGQFSMKDSDYGDLLITELAKVL